jgi:hypothetical protein
MAQSLPLQFLMPISIWSQDILGLYYYLSVDWLFSNLRLCINQSFSLHFLNLVILVANRDKDSCLNYTTEFLWSIKGSGLSHNFSHISLLKEISVISSLIQDSMNGNSQLCLQCHYSLSRIYLFLGYWLNSLLPEEFSTELVPVFF